MQLNHTYLAAVYGQLAALHMELAKAQDERDAALQECDKIRHAVVAMTKEPVYDGVDSQP